MIAKLKSLKHGLYRRYFYLLNRLSRKDLPEYNLACLPDGLTVRKVGDTGVSIVENFCTAEEAAEIRRLAEPDLQPARIFRDGKAIDHPRRRCQTALIFGAGHLNQILMPIACRAAALTGLPYNHMEGVIVTRYGEGDFYREHVDYGDNPAFDRPYTILVYLSDMAPEQGGSTVFPALNMEVVPRLGRAVCWANAHPDGSGRKETLHAASPVKAGGEKWVIQFWFHRHKMFSRLKPDLRQAMPGKAIEAEAEVPSGVRFYEKDRR